MVKHILTALVKNRSGVLARVSGLFSRRGYNIDSLSVCATEDADYSRMTIVTFCDDYIISQITKQLSKLPDIKKVLELKNNESVFRELLLIKLSASSENRSQIVEIGSIYKAKTVDLSPDSMILELTGESNKLDAFITVLEPFDIMEMVRTGITALSRGNALLKEER